MGAAVEITNNERAGQGGSWLSLGRETLKPLNDRHRSFHKRRWQAAAPKPRLKVRVAVEVETVQEAIVKRERVRICEAVDIQQSSLMTSAAGSTLSGVFFMKHDRYEKLFVKWAARVYIWMIASTTERFRSEAVMSDLGRTHLRREAFRTLEAEPQDMNDMRIS